MNLSWIHLETVSSTNSYLQERIRKKDIRNEVVVVADYQEHGKGQGSNAWHSERGANLLMSMLLYPAFLSASRQFHLSMMTSLALIDTLVEHGVEVSIKWPNDILVPSGKIAGILIENGIMGGHLVHSIIGIGLNVNQSIFPDFPIKASSLAMETSRRLDPALLAKEISNRILERFNQLKIGTGPSLQEEYLEHLYQLDQPSLFISEGREFIGVIRGINEFGELQVETGSSVKTFSMHSIRLKG